MGLDMYACTTERLPDKPVDFDISLTSALGHANDTLLFQWRKHPNLHGWMEKLYFEKGGQNEDFNCVPLLLTPADLDRLEEAIEHHNLPHTTGFFFGQSRPEDIADDREFIAKARAAIKDGLNVYYSAWW